MSSILVLNKTRSLLERLTWSETTQNWNVYLYVPRDQCESYGVCGAYGNCITTQSPICQCLEGFKPKSPGYMDWSKGCVRNKALNYSKLDGFIKFNGLKLPDAKNSWVNKSMNLKQCRVKCLENSSCMAYTNLDIRGGGNGCAIWFGDLIDIKQSINNVQDLFIRMSASELGTKEGPKMKIVVIVTAIAAVAGVLIVGYYIYKSRTNLGFVRVVSFEKSASKRSEKQLSVKIGVLGFLICSGVLSSVLDFDFDSIDGFGKFSVAVLMSCVMAFLYTPTGKNARSFWLGSDQLRSNLEIFSRG
ncbi:hypothetical protein LWI29_002527 [Acer saccharum]|uniref:non-specific serine/threonine protein kinase n=1 Tax=Acer saccharum TaxID=4024 RepID=A0AA39SJ92_ACESA|nr:hypothetical protein LWI29_002527 [Acer saccharum]